MSLNKLPPELLDIIFEDTPLSGLGDVALVCRAFYDICRPRLPQYHQARDVVRHLELTGEDAFEGSILNVLGHLAQDPAQCRWIETADLLKARYWSYFELDRDDNPVQQILGTLQGYILEQSPACANTTFISFTAADFRTCEEEEHNNVLLLVLLSLLPYARAIRLPLVLDDLVSPLRDLVSRVGRNGKADGERTDFLDFLIEQANRDCQTPHRASLSKVRNLELTRMAIEDRNVFLSMRGLTRLSLTHFAAFEQPMPCYQHITTAHFDFGVLGDRRIEEFFEQAKNLKHLSIWHRLEYVDDQNEDIADNDDCIYTVQALARCIEDKLSNTLESLMLDGNVDFYTNWHTDPDFPEFGPKNQLSFRKLARLRKLVLNDSSIAAFALPMMTFAETVSRASAVFYSGLEDGHVYDADEIDFAWPVIDDERRMSLLSALLPTSLVQLGIFGDGGYDFSLTLENLFTGFPQNKHILPYLEKITLSYGHSQEDQESLVQPRFDLRQVLGEAGVELETQVSHWFNRDGRLRDRVES